MLTDHTERAVIKLAESKRGRTYQSKSRSCKLDYGYVIVESEDQHTIDYFSRDGMTASIPHENYRQRIDWKEDNRCKPERGVFLCKVADISKICWKQKQIYGMHIKRGVV